MKETSRYHCTNCGNVFTDKMNQAMTEKMTCFCENCGQMFVAPNLEQITPTSIQIH